eukprot:3462227-Amphidinium_carterae.1
MAGSIPGRLFLSGKSVQKTIGANELRLEGTLPKSAGRMSAAGIIMSVGHGLKGFLPRTIGTLDVLCLWENGLEGYFPELHISPSSVLFVHANDFSCALPRHCEVKPTSIASLALIGNHFAQPRRHLPAWITSAERPSDMFCLSNKQGEQFVVFLTCAACLFALAALICKIRSTAMGATFTYVRFARERSAWYATSRHTTTFLVTSCVLLVICSNMLSLTCTTASDHLRIHFVVKRRELE